MKILGLDLGVTSIGWALIDESDNGRKIIGMGSRIIPLSTDDKDEFSSGNTISKNQKRTTKRTQRKGYDRYQLRRCNLKQQLSKAGMLPDETLIKLPSLDLWGLRAKAVDRKISLTELGRVLLHLNQKRGYKSSRSDANLDKKDTEYVAEVKNRHQALREAGKTIGQFFNDQLQGNPFYRIKQHVFPREAYIEEFDKIFAEQRKHWANVLTQDFIMALRDEIIYYQRKLKSQKGLVSVCELEGFWTKKWVDGKEKEFFVGPKVAPRSSPLFQVCKIWETINSITLKNKRNEKYEISIEQKKAIFEYLDCHENLSQGELLKILGLKKTDGWNGNKQISKGLQGNLTKTKLLKYIDQDSPLLQFDINIQEKPDVNRHTGEILPNKKVVSSEIERQPFFTLWHIIYSISDQNECAAALQKKFGLDPEKAKQLASIDFTTQGFSNKSSKAIRNLLPHLMNGRIYSDAEAVAGYNQTDPAGQGLLRETLLDSIPLLAKNSLRQPIVEKILNHVINLVNNIIDVNRGWITKDERENNLFEIRIELARELKQSKEERNDTFTSLSRIERENDGIRKRIETDYRNLGIRPTRNNVIKWRLFHEITNDESKLNAVCIYCGQPFGISDALSGNAIDIEHIVPKSLLFDDSQSNKTLTHRKCNADKDDQTAFDFMSSKGTDQLAEYIERVDRLYRSGIIKKGKRDKFLMPADKIPPDFINRQLGETRYISRKAKELLGQICRKVTSTSGTVTAYLRDKWGWNDVLLNLQLKKYRDLNLTEWREWQTHDGQKHKAEVIKEWSKRDDHRHHAIDALVVACTQQGFIQRINTLSAQHTRKEMRNEVTDYKNKLSLLDNYIVSKRPFTTQQLMVVTDKILVSFKSGKKVATLTNRKIMKGGKKIVVQQGIITPRGALSEESVYGKIKTIEKVKPIKYLFENPDLIFKPYIKQLVQERLIRHDNDSKKALASLKNDPIYLDTERTKVLQYATCYRNEAVIKYPVQGIKPNDVKFIIDERVKKIIAARLEKFNNKEKEAFKDLENNPVWFNEAKKIPIKSVRMLTGLTSVEAVKFDENGNQVGFVKPGNNHHLAFYLDKNGDTHVHACTFWHAVERKKYRMPVVIENPREVWDLVLKGRDEYSNDFLKKLPIDEWTFKESLQQNEMFLLDLNPSDIPDVLQDGALISKNLYRVQKLSMKGNGAIDLWFRHHLETELNDTNEARVSKRFYNVQSVGALQKLHPVKVIVNNLGELKIPTK